MRGMPSGPFLQEGRARTDSYSEDLSIWELSPWVGGGRAMDGKGAGLGAELELTVCL